MYTLKIIAVPFPKHYYVQSKEIAFLTTIRLPRCDMLKHLLQKRGSGIYCVYLNYLKLSMKYMMFIGLVYSYIFVSHIVTFMNIGNIFH